MSSHNVVQVCPKNPNGLKSVLLKTAADQLLWAPVMTCVFFAVLKSLEGHPELILSTIQVRCLLAAVPDPVRCHIDDAFPSEQASRATPRHPCSGL